MKVLPARAGTGRQLSCFVLIGLCSTAAYLALYTLLRGALSAQLANALALLVTAVTASRLGVHTTRRVFLETLSNY